jgi:DNA-binding NarL/FixJ family response regulator
VPSDDLLSVHPPVTALLADSHALFSDALHALLEVSGLRVPVVAANTAEAIDHALRWRPQIALIDMRLEPEGGVAATHLLVAELPQLPILVLATDRLDPQVADALRAGAWGYLLKGEEPDVLLRAIVACARGIPILSPDLARFLLRELEGESSDPERGVALTPAESRLLWDVAARSVLEPTATARTIMAKLHRRHRRGA